MKASIAALSIASLLSSATASHGAHAGFHIRRNAGGYEFPSNPNPNVCTVYKTVTVYAEPSHVPPPVPVPAASNVTSVAVPTSYSAPAPSLPAEQPKAPEVPAPVPQPSKVAQEPKPSKVEEKPQPSQPAAEQPYPSKPTTEQPKPSKPAEDQPKPSKPADEEKPKPSKPVEEKPQPSKPADEKPKEGGSYGGNNGRIVTKGQKWAITYTPYTQGGQCKSQGEVKSDVKKIAELGFTTVRVYSTDCSAFENIGPACQENGLKMIIGVFLEGGGKGGKGPFSDYANKQVQDIKSKAPKDLISMVIVGNEALFNGYCTAEELGSYIDYVRQELQGAGFPKDIAITTTDVVDVWESKGKALCSHIDVFTVQVHPFFTSKVSASKAGEFAKEQLDRAASVCPEVAKKGKYISEIGWPHGGQNNGAAIAGASEQKEAIKDILKEVGKESCLFSFQDDHWKNPGAFGVEQKFGTAGALA